jgi:tetratricopeptide (TPR) repeat protein
MYRFHGRALELLELERAFRQHNAVVVSGMGGMGKTALAREAAAWWLRTGLFERAVFTSFEQKAGAANAILLLGRALEGDDFSRRSGDETDPQSQRQTAVRLFHENSVLVVWDNFESTLPIYQQTSSPGGGDITAFSPAERLDLQALYRQLTEGKPKGRLLVTCRPQETGLAGIKEYPLEGLKRPDSLHLLAAALDVKGIRTDRPGYERHAIAQLLSLLDDHPLSIELIAPHLKTLTPAQVGTDFAQLLERFTNPEALEYRNRGLLASLDFSRTHLSPAAQQALPWLAWFEGGVFEAFLLAFYETQPEAWEGIRAELGATALLKVEVLEEFKPPYLRFHPTLRYAAQADQVPDPPAAESRFIEVYLDVMRLADSLLGGQQPGTGMRLVALEEANLRRAMQLAFARSLRQEGGWLADTLRLYLERAGRNRERDALVEWVHTQLAEEVLDEAACAAIRQHAWALFTQGQAEEAVQMVQNLLERLQSEGLAGGEDPAFQIAASCLYLGRMYYHAGRADLALEPAGQAIRRFEQLEGEVARSNLAAALGDLANTYSYLGRYAQALQAAERALAIQRELKHEREIATDLGRIAGILADMHRYQDAEQRYAEALDAARAAGDWELQGSLLQHQGLLQREQGHYARAVELFKQAIAIFQHSNDPGGEMQTCDLLATAERERGELDSAEAWYARARQLAGGLHDRPQLAVTAQNLGILYQTRAEAAADPQARQAWLEKAIAAIRQSLALKLEDHDQLGAASSYFQLGVLYTKCGELEAAQENLLQALAIYEPLDHPELVKDYYNLAEIARLRGEQAAAAEWQAKYEAKEAELERLERGEGGGGQVDEQLVKFILQLAQLCYQVRVNKTSLPPEAAEALAQLCAAPAPLSEVGASLQATAAGGALPPLPEGLPPAIAGILQALQGELEG